MPDNLDLTNLAYFPLLDLLAHLLALRRELGLAGFLAAVCEETRDG